MASTHRVAEETKRMKKGFALDRKWVYVIIALLVLYSLSIFDYMAVERL